jgi:hypothetical protein
VAVSHFCELLTVILAVPPSLPVYSHKQTVSEQVGPRLQDPALHRQLPLLVCPALDCGCLAISSDHSHSLVNPGDHVVRRAALQESDAVLAASRQDAVARRLHFHWVRLARACAGFWMASGAH